MYKKINRNTMFNSNRTPRHIFTESLWMPDEEIDRTRGVQITELRSSASEQTMNDDEVHVDPCTNCKGDNEMNEYAREKHLNDIKNQQQRISSNSKYDSPDLYDDHMYGNMFVPGTSGISNENIMYNQVNCFTIYDQHILDSDSSDDYIDIENRQCEEEIDWNRDSAPDWNRGPMYDPEFVRCDPYGGKEKRTVWIYSYENRHLLSENDFELGNVPGSDNLSKSSSTETEDVVELKTVCPKPIRVATPVPHCSIPKLNIVNLIKTPTLPTVTEDTEPKVSIYRQTEEQLKITPKENNWLSDPVTSINEGETAGKSTSVINWMALSPRQKKRRFRHGSPITFPYDMNTLPTVKEASSAAERNEGSPIQIETKDCGDNIKEPEVFIKHREKAKKGHDKATNTDFYFSYKKYAFDQMCSSVADTVEKSANSLQKNIPSAIGSFFSIKENYTGNAKTTSVRQSLNTQDANVSFRDIGNVSTHVSPNVDRDDYNNRKVPRISIPSEPAVKIPIDSLEILESNAWIEEEKIIDDDRIRTPVDEKGDRAIDPLWARHMALLKPSEWSAYMSIAETIPSFHLTMNSDSIEETDNWFRRIVKFFRCCK